ncbi:hypothetical protein Tco_0966179, partial [Tanacetum coccineum]
MRAATKHRDKLAAAWMFQDVRRRGTSATHMRKAICPFPRKEKVPQDSSRPISDEDLREYCDKNYHQILPIIAEKVHQEKVHQEKLKAVKAHLNFEEASQHSESGTPIRRRGPKERLGPRRIRSRSGSPEP